MNTQLVQSIFQVVQSLPEPELHLFIEQLHQWLPQTQTSSAPIDPEAWEVWRSLGDDATEGQLQNPSINCDRYLYTQGKSNPHPSPSKS